MGKVEEEEGREKKEEVYQYLGLAGTQTDKCESPRVVGVLIWKLEGIVQGYDNKTRRKYNVNGDSSTMTRRKCNVNGDCTTVSSYVRGDDGVDGVRSRDVIRKKMRVFEGVTAPGIGIGSYVMRIFKYAKCSPCCFALAYAYMSRLSAIATSCCDLHAAAPACPPLLDQAIIDIVSPLSVHRLLITSVMLAAKFVEDSHFNNAYFAKIGGISTIEMNGLEMAFLKLIRYRLHVTHIEFDRLCFHFAKETARQAILAWPSPPHIQSHSALKACNIDDDHTISLLCTQ